MKTHPTRAAAIRKSFLNLTPSGHMFDYKETRFFNNLSIFDFILKQMKGLRIV